jgi:hypothetical protein
MKKNIVLLGFVAVMFVVAGVAFAGMGVQLRMDIPFAFYVEDQLLPAGEYRFDMGTVGIGNTASSVVVRAKDGTGIRLLSTMGDTNENQSLDRLHFNQYGDKFFLSSVAIRSYKANVRSARLERELRTQIERAGKVILVAKN